MILDLRAAVWRRKAVSGTKQYTDVIVYRSLPVAITPVSSFDSQLDYAWQATHIVWTPAWAMLRQEDQVRYGRRLPDAFNNVVPFIYAVTGRRRTTQGIPQVAWYCEERH